MSNAKKILLSLVVSCYLVSCGSTSDSPKAPPAQENETTETPPPVQAPAPTPTEPTPTEPTPTEPTPTEPTPTEPTPTEPTPTEPTPTEPTPTEPTPTEPTPEPAPEEPPSSGRTCPENYELVGANSALNTADICIAKFEMKNVDGKAASISERKPWLADRTTATEACSSLGQDYRLPTNAEWNATALEIYNNKDNWSDDKDTEARLYTGFHSDSTEPIEVKNTQDPYDGTRKKKGNERRTFTLASGKVLWDFGGNAWEWVSDRIYGSSYQPDLSGNFSRRYHNNNTDIKPGSKALLDFTGMSAVGKKDVYMGHFFGGSSGKVIRGGAVGMPAKGVTGIFAANIGDITADELQAPASSHHGLKNIGFRCVTKPK